ncbi:hypothetical protein OF83DRAFT_1164457 [Amylostereum chailletii]|nr:hypothetical protein OF83DRAFT_1164457 [Amylostereum chailletii]
MVADEAANGTADLPVIDFADLDAHHAKLKRAVPRKQAKKMNKNVPPPPPIARATSAPAASPSPVPPSPVREPSPPLPPPHHETDASAPPRRGQTARQAYQERLESDPSFVPKVGGFWGHDDRLLDKDLRSLSPWWRGRWQGRGAPRGRGRFNNAFIARGRGGAFPPSPTTAESAQQDAPPLVEEVLPPVEREWNHDGFEEMKKRDEQRAAMQAQRGFGGFRGGRGGGFISGRGRGFGRAGMPSAPYTTHLAPSPTPRTWYAMKPERVWTKHHETFLHSDPALKPRVGLGPGYRIKLSGKQDETVVRAPPRTWHSAAPEASSSSTQSPRPTAEPVVVAKAEPEQTPAPTELPPVEEESVASFTITQPPPATVIPIPAQPTSVEPEQAAYPLSAPEPAYPPPERGVPVPHVPEDVPAMPPPDSALWNPSHAPREMETQPEPPVPAPDPQAPVLPPIQTSVYHSPMHVPSPSYGSPYAYTPLPPGIAVNQQGYTYEVATGRVVYLQPAPPPPPPPSMYQHQPPVMGMHAHPPGLPFVPQHFHHHSHSHSSISLSPDPHQHQHPHPHSPTPAVPLFAETPIFAPPRQSSRIEIRRPNAEDEGKKSASPRPRGPSGLRASVTLDQEGVARVPEFYPREQQMMMEGMGYSPYPQQQQQYYYPEQHYAYPHNPYEQAPPPPPPPPQMQYEYPPEMRGPPGVYY